MVTRRMRRSLRRRFERTRNESWGGSENVVMSTLEDPDLGMGNNVEINENGRLEVEFER